MSVALSKQHRAILAVFETAGSGKHLSAADIFEQLRSHETSIGLATVHRALQRLREEGKISRVEVPGQDSALYEIAGPPHAHFTCRTCRIVLDTVLPEDLFSLSRHAAPLEAKALEIHIHISGICSICSKTGTSFTS